MDRSEYIGSSDAKDILSGDWSKLYKQKIGDLPQDNLSDNFPVQLGRHVEDFHLDWTVRRLFEQTHDKWRWSKFTKDGDQHFATYHPESGSCPPLGSHPDALLKAPTGVVHPLEVKITARWRNAEEAADFYMPQLQHHMLCWNVDSMLFSVIVGTKEPERLWVGASRPWVYHYTDRCIEFWDHVVNRTPPPPAMHLQRSGDLPSSSYVPKSVAATVPINGYKKRDLNGDNQAGALVDDFIRTKEAVAEHEKAKNALKKMMAEDEGELTHERLTLKRDARGAIRINVHDKTAA